MKKKLYWIFSVLLSCTLFYACIDDESSGFKTEGSPITITTSDTVFDVEQGLPVTIDPDVTQTEPDLPLTYEWRAMSMDKNNGEFSDSLKFIGVDRVLNYTFKNSGVYKIRLRVENKYRSEFKNFTVNVLAPFDQGILVLSNDENDNGRLSFLRAKSETEILDKKETDFNLNAFYLNSDIQLRGVRDAMLIGNKGADDKAVSQLIISSETNGMLYFTETKSFLVEYMVNVTASFPDLGPTTICSSGDNFFISELVFLGCRNKNGNPANLYALNTRGQFCYPDEISFEQKAVYDKVMCTFVGKVTDFSRYTLTCCIDNTTGKLHLKSKSLNDYDVSEIMEGRKVVGAGFFEKDRVIFVMQEDADPTSISVYKTKSQSDGWSDGVMDGIPYTYKDENLNLPFGSDLVASDMYQSLFYSRGNEIYRWSPYVTSTPALPTLPIITLSDKDEITCMAISPDELYLYVCVYNPQAKTELKGKLLIMNVKTLKIVKEFPGISDRAVKVMWKDSKMSNRS